MNLKKSILALAAAVLPFSAFAQTTSELSITFEDGDNNPQVGVYDWWEESPFRIQKNETQPRLQGNCYVVDNPDKKPDEITGNVANPSNKVLGFERSIYGSNMYGARIFLKTPLSLNETTKYVHVKMLRPSNIEGRVMLIGLGKHSAQAVGANTTWKDQTDDIEQFTVIGKQKPAPGYWSDVVFPINSAPNVEIHSLVVCVDCESPHRLDDDFVVYIDDIEVNNVSRPSIALRGDYPVCFDKEVDQQTHGSRMYNNITVQTNAGTFVKKANGRMGLTEAFDSFIPVKRGTQVSVTTSFSGNAMHSFVYFDANRDGRFDENTNEYVNGRKGASATHTFTIPADQAHGVYRLRAKVDWESTDPAGNDATSNFILSNGGGMIDALLYVYDESTTVKVSNSGGLNGDIVQANGERINDLVHDRGTDLPVKWAPAEGFECAGMKITVGNIGADPVHSNPQYIEFPDISYRQFDDDGNYIIPAEYLYTDLNIEGVMVENGHLPLPEFAPTSKDPIDGKFRPSSQAITLKIKGHYVTLDDRTDDGSFRLTSNTEPTNANGYWVVCGDDVNGYQVHNVAEGPSRVLGCTGEGANARFRLYDVNAIPSGVTTLFDYSPNQIANPHKVAASNGRAAAPQKVAATNDFNTTFRLHGSANNCWNDRTTSNVSYLALWDNAAALKTDAGSSIEVKHVVYDFENPENNVNPDPEPTPTATVYQAQAPITSPEALVNGTYFVSLYSKGLEGLLYGNANKTISANTATEGYETEDANLVWTVNKNEEGLFTLTNSSDQTISIQGNGGEGKGNVLYTVVGNNTYDAALFTLVTPAVTINEVPHFMTHQQKNMTGSTTLAYLHVNNSALGTADNSMRLSFWGDANPSTEGGITCAKLAFYPAIIKGAVTPLQAAISAYDEAYKTAMTYTTVNAENANSAVRYIANELGQELMQIAFDLQLKGEENLTPQDYIAATTTINQKYAEAKQAITGILGPEEGVVEGVHCYIRNTNPGDNRGYVAVNLASTGTTDNKDNAALFVKTVTGQQEYKGTTYDKFTLYNETAGKWVGLAEGKNLTSGAKAVFANIDDAAAALEFIYVGDDIIAVKTIEANATSDLSWNWNGGASTSNTMGTWGATDSSSAWAFEIVDKLFDSTKVYKIVSKRNDGVLYAPASETSNEIVNTKGKNIANNDDDIHQQFAIIPSPSFDSAYYLYSVAADKFLTCPSKNTNTHWTLSDAPVLYVSFEDNTINFPDHPWFISATDIFNPGDKYYAHMGNQSNAWSLITWADAASHKNDGGNGWQIEEVGTFDADKLAAALAKINTREFETGNPVVNLSTLGDGGEMHYYTIRNVNKNTYANYKDEGAYLQNASTRSDYSVFYFTEAEGSVRGTTAVHIHAFKADADKNMTDWAVWNTTPTVWYITSANGTDTPNDYNIGKDVNLSTNQCWNYRDNGIQNWSAGNDKGSAWFLEEVTRKTYTLHFENTAGDEVKIYDIYGNEYADGSQITAFFLDGSTFFMDQQHTVRFNGTVTTVGNDAYLGYSEFHTIGQGTRPDDIDKYSLWYDTPATKTGVSDMWMEYALPMGNGQLGATIIGGVMTDKIQFNEKTLWEGKPTNGSSVGQGYYQNLGSILVKDMSNVFSTVSAARPASDYVRYLDIMDGVAGVRYKNPATSTQYSRTYFTSMTEPVFVARYEANGTDKLDLLFSYDPDGRINPAGLAYTDSEGTYHGQLMTVKYDTRFRLITDGQKARSEAGIRVSNASYVTVIMAAATDYDASKTNLLSGETAEALAARITDRIDHAAATGYDQLLASHKAKQRGYMGRVDLNIGGASNMTTEALVRHYNAAAGNKESADGLFLENLYFQYGRYMTVAANADYKTNVPSNLQGIWNDRSNTSFWHCDIHADINVEMNYWPADPTNLSEMHLPFLYHIIDLAQPGKPWSQLVQRIKPNARGWHVSCESNIFGGGSTWENGRMKTLNAWYCSHLWRYYKYTKDTEFLKKALAVMLTAAQFIIDVSVEDAQDPGKWVVPGEWSPEHGETGVTAFSQQNGTELFSEILAGHADLLAMGETSPLTEEQVAEIREFAAKFDDGIKIENYTFTRDNQRYNNVPCIAEWKHIALSDPGHRHLSHLMCVFPYNQITAYGTSQLEKDRFAAAQNAILARNGDVTGWSMGWQTNIYARLLQGDNARGYLSKALKHSTSYVIAMGGQGGCYYNLFDAHSPFQIDGNYGCTSGVAEMLLQSYDDTIHLLPALPNAWTTGHVKGLKAVGNFTVDQTWENNVLTGADITSNMGGTLRVHYGDKVAEIPSTLRGQTYHFDIQNGELVYNLVDANVVTITDYLDGVHHGNTYVDTELQKYVDLILKKSK